MRDSIYYSAMLHDLGEFSNVAHKSRENHALASYNIVKDLKVFRQVEKMKDLIINHHNPKTEYEKIIRAADLLSCKEEKYEEAIEELMPNMLRPVFIKIKESENGVSRDYVYDIKQLDLDNIFPKEFKGASNLSSDYARLFNQLKGELDKVRDLTQILPVLEKHLWSIPVNDIEQNRDISMYEHAKNAAAIALCLYDQYEAGELDEVELDNIETSTKEQFILIHGDISGIQDFIMNISSKGAAKSLKSHSIYLSLLTDIVVKYILDGLELKEANLLYSGGGSLFILAPKTKKNKMDQIGREIMRKMLNAHNEVFFAIDYIYLTPEDFVDFPSQWRRAVEKTNRQKYRKWAQLDEDDKYELIFGPFDEGTKEGEHCNICGISYQHRMKSQLIYEDIDLDICSLCKSFIDLTDKLREAKYLYIGNLSIEETKRPKTYMDIFKSFGYKVDFTRDKNFRDGSYYLLNSTDFLKEGCQGFKYGAYGLPKKGNDWLTFKQIAAQSKGDTNLLGVLKLDVDNLGAIFGFGLEDNKTISRITTLSRMMTLYFEGYINKIIENLGYSQSIYVVFSGGDDTFVIGAWDKVLQFAAEFRKKFGEFVCWNKKITFSCGIGLFSYDYPVIRSISITESSLNKAKGHTYSNETMASKDKITLLGEVFNWEEYRRILNIKNLLIETIETAKIRSQNNIGRALLFKIQRSTAGFKRIIEDSNKGKVNNLRFWNLAYYLREVKEMDEVNDSKFADKIIQEYREIVLHNLLGKSQEEKIKNIMIIPVATKLAELATREIRGEDK